MTAPVVLVTGCTEGGIGYELCKAFSTKGCRVYATARRIESMKGLEDFNCTKIVLDVTNLDSINTCFQKVIAEAGHIDILVNNAGAPAIGALLDIDYEVAHRCIETNVFGVLSMCKVVGRHMADRKSGKIVNIGSVTGYVSLPWSGIYSLSKAAVHSMSDCLRVELSPFNVHVSVVAPGSITSNFGNASINTVNIPENSLYTSVAKFIYERANLSQGKSSTPTHVFAETVVARILVPKPKAYITMGGNSTVFLILYYLPHWVKDFFLAKRLGINQVKTLTK